MTRGDSFVCSLEPTEERFSLVYEGARGAAAGTATIVGDGVATAETTWGAFHITPYEAGESGSVDVFAGDDERIGTVLVEDGPDARWVVRDRSTAPILTLEPIDSLASPRVSAAEGGISIASLRSFQLCRVGGEFIGTVLRGQKLLRPGPKRRIHCVSHTLLAGDSGGVLADPRLLAAIVLAMATIAGDPHEERDPGDALRGTASF